MIRRIIEINEEKCNGCGACASACHEGAIGMVNGKAKLLNGWNRQINTESKRASQHIAVGFFFYNITKNNICYANTEKEN